MAAENEKINILYEDSFLAVAVKPRGYISEDTGKNCFPEVLKTALGEARLLRGESGEFSLYTVHRLDRDTEGIIVYALDAKTAGVLSAQLGSDTWEKIYTAVLPSAPEMPSGTLVDLLYYDRAKNKSFVVKRERKGVKRASLEYITENILPDGRAIVKIKLHTGRTHQIRVQFASRTLPLCGDRKYGSQSELGGVLCLCASSLSFVHPRSGEKMTFEIKPTFI